MKQHLVRIGAYFGKERTQIFGEEGLEWTEDFFTYNDIGLMTRYSGSRFYSYRIFTWYGLKPVYNEEFAEAYDGKYLGAGAGYWKYGEFYPTDNLGRVRIFVE